MHKRQRAQEEFRPGEPVQVIGHFPGKKRGARSFIGVFRGMHNDPGRPGPTLAIVHNVTHGEMRVAALRLRKIKG